MSAQNTTTSTPLTPKTTRRAFLAASASSVLAAGADPRKARAVHIVPNFHPASCGWLTNFSKERVYCANSYFDHLDRVRDDPNYEFVLSECNNMIAMLNFRPERIAELKRRVREGRVELVNAFFLESTVNLSGGEALVRLGVEGLRWQQEVFGVRPRVAWCIDVCGTHDQMAQITAGLGLDALVYTRKNPTDSVLHWLVSPDGTRTLAVAPGHYSDLGEIFTAKEPLTASQMDEVRNNLAGKEKRTPPGVPLLVLGGHGDYSLPPARKDYPSALLQEWSAIHPSTEVRFTTFSKWLDRVLPGLKSGTTELPAHHGGTAYDFHAFWIECPRVKTSFRRCEHALQAAEMLASIASLEKQHGYPAEALDRAWLQMFVNMDRNTLWGAAGGMVFEHETSWDVRDRFESVAMTASNAVREAGRALAGAGDSVALFNPLNWERRDPVVLEASHAPAGATLEALPDGKALCAARLGPVSVTASKRAGAPAPANPCPVPELIETEFYTARLDARTGALVSLRPKPSGREMLGGPANVIVAEKPTEQKGSAGDFIQFRPERLRSGSSSDSPSSIQATRGPLALTVTAEGRLGEGAPCTRTIRFYDGFPRIDFEITLRDVPDQTVVLAEFPLERDVLEARNGVPYGFAHGAVARPDPALQSWVKGIVPAVRWSHCSVEGGGFAILDRGLSGRELNGRTPVIYLLNAVDKYYGYPNSWLSGKGEHHLAYAIVAHDGDWAQARIPRMAWEYVSPPVAIPDSGGVAGSFLETSDNVIVESMRRTGKWLEVRLAECIGAAGTAEVKLGLPHKRAWATDLTGRRAKPLSGGPHYRFPVRAQEIVTLRFAAAGEVAVPKPLLEWDPLVPPAKRAALHQYSQDKGHPPRGD